MESTQQALTEAQQQMAPTQEELRNAQAQAHEVWVRVATLEPVVHALSAATSWRETAPLPELAKLLRGGARSQPTRAVPYHWTGRFRDPWAVSASERSAAATGSRFPATRDTAFG